MSLTPLAAAFVVAVTLVTSAMAQSPSAVQAGRRDPHAYFNELVARADYWKSFSFRDAKLIGRRPFLTYDPPTDTDPHRQDAAKIVVPAFIKMSTLAAPVSPTDSTITIPKGRRGVFFRGRVIQIDQEVLTVVQTTSPTTVEVTRGTYRSTAAGHQEGADVRIATNTLPSKLRVPLGTEDGHRYFFVWDCYWTDSFMDVGVFNHKAFQFFSGSRNPLGRIWFEPQATYGRVSPPYVARFQVRSYNKPGGDANWRNTNGDMLGPGAKSGDPLSPRNDFSILPNTWTRFFVQFDQRVDDYDLVDMWIADEKRDAVQVLSKIPVSVRATGVKPNSILAFQPEFNSSNDSLVRPDLRDLVAYVRNFVALRDVRDVQPLLARPAAGTTP